jgi:hypothetical protein
VTSNFPKQEPKSPVTITVEHVVVDVLIEKPKARGKLLKTTEILVLRFITVLVVPSNVIRGR